MSGKFGREELDELFSFKSIMTSSVLHAILLMMTFSLAPPEHKPREDAIVVTMVSTAEVPKQKILKEISPFKESEVVKQPIKKVIAGTQKVVPKAKTLGNPNAPTEKVVQKGDPLSTDFSKYKKDTDFRKLQATNVGTGAGPKLEGAQKLGGGSGDTYKGLDFATKSLTNNAPLGGRFKIKNAADDMGAGAGSSGGIGNGAGKGFGDGTITGSPNGTIETAKILTNVGSLTGATVGAIDSSRGSEGLSQKGSIVLSGEPDETVVLGSMDPDVIRRILLEHLAQFRYCYQSELDAGAQRSPSGVVHLNFSINSTGNVADANVGGGSGINSKLKNCVTTVLRGIQFPAPRGGARVEVKQPMNFYAKQF